ncbi:unnamed protein product [Effrenium voratum]|uniref:Uncharacterized protein n=1 Tax=Effrenium voratum TaxID=2562239 RepID=A0AA36ICP9_9DINO|nr:unnamed protein product [Effrenium voratum]
MSSSPKARQKFISKIELLRVSVDLHRQMNGRDPSKGEKDAAEKAALEAAFEAMHGQDGRPRGRVFSFNSGMGGVPPVSTPPEKERSEEEDTSPAFGARREKPRPPSAGSVAAQRFARNGGWQSGADRSQGQGLGPMSLDERMANLEELLARCHESQMRRQQELEVSISDRCGVMVQEVLQSMIPQMVESFLDRMAQSLDFSELRDQLIEAFHASTELLPLVEERSEAILSCVQDESMVRNRMAQEVSRVASNVDTLASSLNWQGPFLERLEELQQSLEAMGRTRSELSPDAAWASLRPEDGKGVKLPASQRRPQEEARPSAAPRPGTAERVRRVKASPVSVVSDPGWYSTPARTSQVPTRRPPPAATPSTTESDGWYGKAATNGKCASGVCRSEVLKSCHARDQRLAVAAKA